LQSMTAKLSAREKSQSLTGQLSSPNKLQSVIGKSTILQTTSGELAPGKKMQTLSAQSTANEKSQTLTDQFQMVQPTTGKSGMVQPAKGCNPSLCRLALVPSPNGAMSSSPGLPAAAGYPGVRSIQNPEPQRGSDTTLLKLTRAARLARRVDRRTRGER